LDPKKGLFSWVSLLPGKFLELGLDFVLEMIECRRTGATQPILWLVIRDLVDLPVYFVNGSVERWAANQCCNSPRL